MKGIVAVDKNWGIGKNNDLLFSLPADMAYFREQTKGKVVVMGSKTLKSFPNAKPLKNRVNIVFHRGNEIFEGCIPVEIMAKRGIDTLRFGPLKPVGFDDPRTGKRPYAVVQLRQDDKDGIIYNIVGFQKVYLLQNFYHSNLLYR